MKSIFLPFLTLYAAARAISSHFKHSQQKSLSVDTRNHGLASCLQPTKVYDYSWIPFLPTSYCYIYKVLSVRPHGASPVAQPTLGTSELYPQSLFSVDIMAEPEKVYGHSDAIYNPLPKKDQLFDIEFLEVAPTPIKADRVFFLYLRGDIPESKKKELGLLDESLINATLNVSSSVVYLDGSSDDDSESLTQPFKTTPFNEDAHLVTRDASGAQVDYLPSSGRGDVLFDFQIPMMFLRSGSWNFNVDARLGDKGNTCLFVMSVTQWLDGGLKR